MRQDMRHVVIDRPRTGGDRKAKRSRRRAAKRRLMAAGEDGDAGPTKESGKPRRTYGYNHKQLSDHLGPLKGYLRKQVGKPWRVVWQDIRSNLNADSTLQKHVLDHVRGYVRLDVRMVDGKPVVPHQSYGNYGLDADGGLAWQPLYRFHDRDLSLYVNPETGLLCRAPLRLRQVAKPKLPKGHVRYGANGDEIRMVRGNPYIQVNGCWHQGVMTPMPEGRVWGVPYQVKVNAGYVDEAGVWRTEKLVWAHGPLDVLFGETCLATRYSAYWDARRHYRRLTHYCSKIGKQLSTGDLKRLGLRNGYAEEVKHAPQRV